ncbi:rRNA processing protein-like protein Bystin [Dothidotthia symphoricarpi CBS 119687]|uniref:rRNA processing protein-like protein Bystin n=1 Tax=Dothidotthia symphoricarpi CBS 119687 TaxID=1392245 RepID=A0A6A6A4Q5_9PLEO|nr:rRNA processing protein-like protein Bystin [Dothidotthia symphoricarpi CBS 119687]KAF2126982.1 rRNA processing protein-like protein Bystin [Dothidotthia symphoricarpi CBS 119687]
MPKAAKSPGGREQRHNPLAEEYAPSDPYKQKSAKRQKRSRDDAEAELGYVDSKSSRKILDIGRQLEEEDEREKDARRPPGANPAFAFETRLGDDDDDDDAAADGLEGLDDDEAWGDDDDHVDDVEIDADDLAAWNKFIPTDDNPIQWPGEQAPPSGPGTDLAALILDKIAAAEAAQPEERREIQGGGAPEDAIELPAKVVEVYSKIGLILSRYKSGKLPKPFKILPGIPAWETLLAITRPENWTPNAFYAATRIFISGKPQTAQVFLNTVLLPAVQDHIRETQKLNVHMYSALKKALYKPSAFFKGVVFPMLIDGTCTQREAVIVASVVAKVSVPVLHSAAALHRLCEIAAEQMSSDPDAAGPCNIFIKTLLEKKYALPYKVIDALVFHFLRFRAVGASSGDAMDTESAGGHLGGTGKLPVIWHQCLLAFAQRYRNDITEDQREAMLDLLLTRGHKSISPEVRRELLEGRGRGVVAEPAPVGVDGDDTMMAMDG